MAGVEIVEIALTVEHTEKHGGIFAYIGMLAKEIVDVVEDARGVGTKRHAGKSALKHGSEQGGADSLSSNIGNDEGGAVIAHGKYIEVIAPNGVTGGVDGRDGEVRKFAEAARQKGLLNFPSDAEFLFEALALAFPLDEPGVVQDAGGFYGQGIEDLAVEFGECGRALRIQIQDAQEVSALNVDDRFLSAGARHRVERNCHNGAKPLRNDALRALQRVVGHLQVARNNASLAFHRHA